MLFTFVPSFYKKLGIVIKLQARQPRELGLIAYRGQNCSLPQNVQFGSGTLSLGV